MKKPRNKDPYAARESARYENPIPSREFILTVLGQSVGPLTADELFSNLGLRGDIEREALSRRLAAMERDGQVVRNRRGAYGTLENMEVIKGRVTGHPEGFGFVVSPESRDDIFLSSRQMRQVFDGDEVLVRVAGYDRRGRAEGRLVEVVEHRTEQLVGRYFCESGVHLVRPDNPRISQDILIEPEATANAQSGQIVLVGISRQPSMRYQPMGKIIQVLGDHLDPGLEIEIALYNYSIPHVWPDEVAAQVAQIKEEVSSQDITRRTDLRHLPLVTIDGEDARDFDDAVYCQAVRNNGWRLYVAIADVAHYVPIGSALDREAYARGNSVYFPGEVVPMLPEKLSNGLCSLRPEVDRLCMVCEMRIAASGEITGFKFYEALMHSRARLTYTQVAAMVAQRGEADSSVRRQFSGVVPDIDTLHALYQALRDKREQRGAIDFDTFETRILFDQHKKIEQIVPSERTDAHRMIEECMLSANVCAAKLLGKSKLPVLYRVHDIPGEEKLSALREFLGELGLGLPGGDEPTPKDFQSVLNKLEDRPDATMIQSVILRSMMQAVYQPENIGHFGLNYEAYSHFTSPIRRYPDLLVHRAIKALLHSKKRVAHLKRSDAIQPAAIEKNYPYQPVQIAEAGDHCSMTERRADEATRSVVNWLKCEYLLEHVGKEYAGVVTGVTGFGLFVELADIYIDGLVHITALPKDYYHHEPAHHRLVGERSGRVFRMGDPLRVRVARVDIDERKIDLDLTSERDREEFSRRKKRKAQVSERAVELAQGVEENHRRKRKPRGKPNNRGNNDAASRVSAKGKAAKKSVKKTGSSAKSKNAKRPKPGAARTKASKRKGGASSGRVKRR